MITILLVVHSIIVLMLIGAVLLQKGESGGFVSSQTSMVSARGAKNFLTRLTAILATLFFANSLLLAILVKNTTSKQREILKSTAVSAPSTPGKINKEKQGVQNTSSQLEKEVSSADNSMQTAGEETTKANKANKENTLAPEKHDSKKKTKEASKNKFAKSPKKASKPVKKTQKS